MSWSWKGFWGDDPVYRFNCGPDFFQAGRSKAEERFWVNYIHDDGSYLKPLRSRLSSRASSIVSTSPRTRNSSTQSDSYTSSSVRTRNSSSSSDRVIVTRVVSEFDRTKFDTSTNTSEDERDGVEGDVVREEEKMSSCSSCSCKQPERERFISRLV